MSKTPEPEIRSDQLAPHSIEAEEAVLGSVLIRAEALLDIIGFLKPDDFFIVRHAWIYEGMLSLQKRSATIDYLTVVNELEQMGRLAEIGGAAYLFSLINKTPSAMNIEGYAQIVVGMSVRRGLIDAASYIARLAHSDETDVNIIQSKSEARIFKATRNQQQYRTVSTLAVASSVYDQAIMKGREGYTDERIYTHNRDVDRLIGGFHPSDLIYVGGRAGMGKTAYVLSILAENARRGIKGGAISLEMSAEQIVTRLIAAEASIPYLRIVDGEIADDEHTQLLLATTTVADWNLPIDDTPFLNIFDLRRIMRRMVLEEGVKFIVVDYVQLLSGGPGYDGKDSREAEVSYISRLLKQLARELNVPIIAPVQLSRALEARKNKRAMLSDMRESGSLEQDADIVIFPYRDSYYSKDETNNVTEIAVAKHRHGRTGMVEVIYLKERMKFVDADRHHVDLNAHLDAPMLLDTYDAPPPQYNGQNHRSNGNGVQRKVYGRDD